MKIKKFYIHVLFLNSFNEDLKKYQEAVDQNYKRIRELNDLKFNVT